MPQYSPEGREAFSNDSTFYSYSSEETLMHNEALGGLAREKTLFPWKKEGDRISLVALAKHVKHSGEAKVMHGIIGITGSALGKEKEKLAKILATHEGVHTHVGGELRRHLIDCHPDVHALLHDELLPAWIAGTQALTYDEHYFQRKEWEGLSPSRSSQRVSIEDAKEIVRCYFGSIKKQLAIELSGQLVIPAPYLTTDGITQFNERPETDIRNLYRENREKIAKLVMTGYELGEQLSYRLRDAKSNEVGADLLLLEENLANYVCTTLNGVTVDDFAEMAAQDLAKFPKARKLQQAEGTKEGAREIIEEVDSYEDLVKFAKEKKWVS